MSAASAYDALKLCTKSVIPNLFPFMVLSSILIGSGFAEFAGRFLEKPCGLLFNLSGSCAAAVIIGAVSGFPAGAKCAVSLYENGSCSKNEAERLLAFCNNAGPSFLIASVGAGVFGDITLGAVLYVSQLTAAVLAGIAVSFPRHSNTIKSVKPTVTAKLSVSVITQAVTSASLAMLPVCGFICFFAVFINIPLCMISNDILRTLICGFTEITNGVICAAAMPDGIIYAALFCGWSGLSVHLQTAAFTIPAELSLKYYFCGKLIQSIFCAVFMSLYIV